MAHGYARPERKTTRGLSFIEREHAQTNEPRKNRKAINSNTSLDLDIIARTPESNENRRQLKPKWHDSFTGPRQAVSRHRARLSSCHFFGTRSIPRRAPSIVLSTAGTRARSRSLSHTHTNYLQRKTRGPGGRVKTRHHRKRASSDRETESIVTYRREGSSSSTRINDLGRNSSRPRDMNFNREPGTRDELRRRIDLVREKYLFTEQLVPRPSIRLVLLLTFCTPINVRHLSNKVERNVRRESQFPGYLDHTRDSSRALQHP